MTRPFPLPVVLALLAAGCGQPGTTTVPPSPAAAADSASAPPASTDPTAADPAGESALPAAASQPEETAEPAGQAGGGQEVALEVADFEQVQRYIQGQKGKVVVLDCWSTACEPCKEEFHQLVEIHQALGPAKVACVSLSFDYIGLETHDQLRPVVLEFLQSQKATLKNFLGREPDEQLYAKWEIDSVPAVLVYDQTGKLAKKFVPGDGVEGVSYAEVRKFVDGLLAE